MKTVDSITKSERKEEKKKPVAAKVPASSKLNKVHNISHASLVNFDSYNDMFASVFEGSVST